MADASLSGSTMKTELQSSDAGMSHDTVASITTMDKPLNTNDNNNNSNNSSNIIDQDINTKSPDKHPTKRRKKVVTACIYCRRSHMNCDESRPCKRCIKRNIGHLCIADSNTSPGSHSPLSPQIDNKKSISINTLNKQQQVSDPLLNLPTSYSTQVINPNQMASTAALNQQPFFYSEHAGSEFNSLTEFLSMIDDNDMMDSINLTNDPMLQKLEATNYIQGIPSSSNINLTHLANNGNDEIDINSHNHHHHHHHRHHHHNNHHLSQSQAHHQNISKMNHQQVVYLQQQLDNQQKSLQQQQQQQQQFDANNPTSSSLQLSTIQPGPQQQQSQLPYKSSNPQYPTVFQQPKSLANPKQVQSTPHISDAARDKFFLTAADPTTEISPEERLKQVINAKLEAGLLKPYNYAKGYQRLQNYMDKYMATSSRARILKPLSTFRPGFRAIAKTLKDIDLILVEESFERMLLDYDRVFTSMAIPACLWRRTGEIYRGNKEFASLVDVSIEDLKNGKLTIYELMTEESSVNFWEKYGSIAFDKTQKAVLTSCNLRTKDGRKKKNCCFSFTIRRDRYNIPSCIVGNFIPIR